jgi:hypothetical protein
MRALTAAKAAATQGPRTPAIAGEGGAVPSSISRADVADFLVEACEGTTWVGHAVQLGG